MAIRTSKQIAEEALRAFAQDTETPEEYFQSMVRAGFINSKGQVTKLLGGTVDTEPIVPAIAPKLV